jgi:hypothetical protein
MSAAGSLCIEAAATIPREAQLLGIDIAERRANQRDPGEPPAETPLPSDPDLWLYRNRTLGMLKRYGRVSVEVGRLPSLLGRELFCARVTSYRVTTIEDLVIFVHDVERSMEKLDHFEKQLIAKIVLQSYSQDEAAAALGCWRRTIGRRFFEAVDRLSEIFLQGDLLARLPNSEMGLRESCQEGKMDENPLSDSHDTE